MQPDAHHDLELSAAQSANVELERRCESQNRDRIELEQRLQALQAENDRLTEHSSISYERAQRLEQQLRDQLAAHNTWLSEADVSCVEGGSEAVTVDHPERVLAPVNHESEVIVLNRKVMSIGRTDDNDIFIPSKLISRQHARLLIGPNAVIVEDADSTNGCYVNDQQVKQHVLREGDVLTLGDLKFRLIIRAPGDARLPDNEICFNEDRRGGD